MRDSDGTCDGVSVEVSNIDGVCEAVWLIDARSACDADCVREAVMEDVADCETAVPCVWLATCDGLGVCDEVAEKAVVGVPELDGA